MKKFIQYSLVSIFIGMCFSSIAFGADEVPVSSEPAATMPTEPPSNVAQTAFTANQVTQLHQIIRDYIIQNPDVLVEASKTLQAQQEKKMEVTAMAAIEKNKPSLFNDPHTPSIGNKDAAVSVVEFFDYQCGHCRQMTPVIEKLVTEDKNLRVIFKELPIFGGTSSFAAKAGLAAAMQNHSKYYKFHNLLLSATGALTAPIVMDLAKKAGLNVVQLKKDMDLPVVDDQIKSNFKLAQELKIMGTPTFVIGNKAETKFSYIPGATSLEDLKAKIASVQK